MKCIHCGGEVKHKGNMGIPANEHMDLGRCIKNLRAQIAALNEAQEAERATKKRATRVQAREETQA